MFESMLPQPNHTTPEMTKIKKEKPKSLSELIRQHFP